MSSAHLVQQPGRIFVILFVNIQWSKPFKGIVCSAASCISRHTYIKIRNNLKKLEHSLDFRIASIAIFAHIDESYA